MDKHAKESPTLLSLIETLAIVSRGGPQDEACAVPQDFLLEAAPFCGLVVVTEPSGFLTAKAVGCPFWRNARLISMQQEVACITVRCSFLLPIYQASGDDDCEYLRIGVSEQMSSWMQHTLSLPA